jgi:signal transduction histidine kinase
MFHLLSKTTRIKQKLIAINLLTTGIALLLTGSALMLTVYVSFRDSLVDNLSSQAKVLAGSSTATLVFNDQKQAAIDLNSLKPLANITRAIIYGKNGSIFAEYQRNGSTKGIIPPLLRNYGHFFTDDHLHHYHPVELDGESIGTVYLQADLKQLHSLMLQYGIITVITMVLVFAVAFLLLTRLQRIITEPIFDLADSMQLVSKDKDYSRKAAVQSEDEIGLLASGFNEMLEHIRKRDLELQLEIDERKRAEEETRKLNEELEIKVDERTRLLLDTQEELVRKEKLAILGQLSGSVGHELRNPLGVMNNAIYFLKTIMPDADETVLEYLDMIKNEIDNSQRIITDLLDFSRTKSPQAKAVPAGELVYDSLDRCVVPENVELKTELPDMLPLIKVDPLQMGQVFQNLITNAVQAMADGGTLRIAAQLAQGTDEKNMKTDTDFVEISVNDTGEGISPEGMKRLFQPLFTTKAKGIGLGLTVCKNIVEANGGRIEVESCLGQGTTVTVSMPVFDG